MLAENIQEEGLQPPQAWYLSRCLPTHKGEAQELARALEQKSLASLL